MEHCQQMLKRNRTASTADIALMKWKPGQPSEPLMAMSSGLDQFPKTESDHTDVNSTALEVHNLITAST